MSVDSSRDREPHAMGNESGASVLLFALTLVVLLGFAAMAIDLSAAWALRRQDQAAVDTGAVAGALFTAGLGKDAAMQAAEDEVVRITYSTMDPDIAFTEWETEWANCVDPAKPSEYTETWTYDCISFTANLAKVRVQMPDIAWKTTFGKVLGVTEIDTTALAEVNIDLKANGGVLPFGMPGSAASDLEVCLKTGANPNGVAPCDGPDTGNFGFLHFTTFGNPRLGTTKDCNTNDLEENIAQGIDHPLGTSSIVLPAGTHTDRDACNDGNFNARPTQVATEPGNVAQALDDGFADGVGGIPGKLTRGDNRISVRGHLLDDTPLWDHLNSDGETLCGTTIATHDELLTCLAGYTSTDGVIFNDDIIDAARFGWVPLFHGTTLGNGTEDLTIKEFRPIYIQTTLWKCNANDCDLMWDPGEPFPPGPSNVRIEASTAITFPAGSLPTAVTDVTPGSDGAVVHLLTK